ncbi:MAG: MG2 domain-containing protein [Acidobacteriota bacterium]
MRRNAWMLAVLALIAAAAPGGKPPSPLTPADLGGEDRYLTYVTTDKPIYREGETVWVRAVMLHAVTHRPMENTPWGQVEIVGPKGDVVEQGGASTSAGVMAFSWRVPAGQAGGGYKVKVSPSGQAPAERSFEIRAFRPPRLKSQIVFLRDGYGPGDDVAATLSVTRAEGGAPAGARVTLVAMVDGREAARQSAGAVDAAGRCAVSFRLPKVIERGEGTLALVIEDGGVVETATKTIPILLNVVDLSLYPESGDLVAGIPTRVYLEARTPARKPADVAGTVESGDGTVVARFRTEHEGRGRFDLTPAAGQTYRLRISQPAGITKVYDLPAVKTDGGIVASLDDVTDRTRALRLRVAASKAGNYRVTVSKLEKTIGEKSISVAALQKASVAIDLPAGADGVLRATLWSADGLPIAERLVFRRPAESVKVSIECDGQRYVPAGTVEMTVKTTRTDGTPVPAVVGISVSDDSVRELLETRDHPPQLPVQVLVETDVWDLADAAVYLSPDDPKAPLALDLLLATQGWRRFAYAGDPKAFIEKGGDRARRALAYVEPPMPMATGDFNEGAMPPPPGAVKLAKEAPMEPQPVRAPMPVMKPQAAAAPEPAAPPVEQPLPQAEEAKKDLDARGADEEDMPFDGKRERQAASRAIAAGNIRMVREFAHAVREGRKPADRVDFTETVYWNAAIETGASGEAKVRFALSDAVTSFRVLCDAFTTDGALGSATQLIESVQPFYVEAKLPLEVTYGDLLRIPVTAVNGTLEPLSGATLVPSAAAPLSAGTLPALTLREGERLRKILDVKVGEKAGTAAITIAGKAGFYEDSVTRSLSVAPLGFPTGQSFGGMVAPGARVTHTVAVPADLVGGSVRATVKVFPSSLGKLTSALERLIQEPYGCFEQTSSTTYPLVMAQQYFKSHTGVDPALVTRSHELPGKGYERLTGFECKTKGYEWFGESPGHEALSAFGLLEFTDMGKVRPVDAAMLARTREWVLATRDGKGGFKRERRALHTWIEDVDCSNAYILWALLETGEPAKNLGPEIEALDAAARASKNGYVHALAANVMQLAGRPSDADALLGMLAAKQNAGGWLDGATASIVGSSGEALQIEATAFAALAWLKSPAHQGNVEKAIRWLAEACQGGRYGSTQSTVLALRAIVAYDTERSKPRAAGSVTVLVDGKAVGNAMPFDEKSDDAIVLPDVSALLTPGKHEIGLSMEKGSELPYAVEVTMNSLTPASSQQCPLSLEVDLTKDRITEGEIAEATVLLSNKKGEPLPMAVAILGLPGGLEPRHEQLKELVKAKAVSAYEVIGREVVLYFRSLDAGEVKRIPLSLIAAIPGTYTGPASRAYRQRAQDLGARVQGPDRRAVRGPR